MMKIIKKKMLRIVEKFVEMQKFLSKINIIL